MDHGGFVALIDAMGGVPMPDGSVADGGKALSLARTRGEIQPATSAGSAARWHLGGRSLPPCGPRVP